MGLLMLIFCLFLHTKHSFFFKFCAHSRLRLVFLKLTTDSVTEMFTSMDRIAGTGIRDEKFRNQTNIFPLLSVSKLSSKKLQEKSVRKKNIEEKMKGNGEIASLHDKIHPVLLHSILQIISTAVGVFWAISGILACIMERKHFVDYRKTVSLPKYCWYRTGRTYILSYRNYSPTQFDNECMFFRWRS